MTEMYDRKQCKLEERKYELPPSAFRVDEPSQIYEKILREGSWARCLSCQEVARARHNDLGKPASSALEHGFAGADDATCGEPVYRCCVCGVNKRGSRFSSMKNKDRYKGLVCNECWSRQWTICSKKLLVAELCAQAGKPVDAWICTECSTIKCKHCNAPVPQATWGSQKVKDHKRRGAGLVCQACIKA